MYDIHVHTCMYVFTFTELITPPATTSSTTTSALSVDGAVVATVADTEADAIITKYIKHNKILRTNDFSILSEPQFIRLILFSFDCFSIFFLHTHIHFLYTIILIIFIIISNFLHLVLLFYNFFNSFTHLNLKLIRIN